MKALKNVRFTRKTAVLVIIVAAVLLAALVLLCSGGGGMETTEERTAYLASLGWEVDAASETGRDVVLPEKLDGVLLQYNEMQLVLHDNELPQRRAGRHRPDLRLRRGSDSGRYPLRKAGRLHAQPQIGEGDPALHASVHFLCK